MLIGKTNDIKSSEITPKDLYLNRRQFILAASATALSASAVLSGLDGFSLASHRGRKTRRPSQELFQHH